MHAGLFVRIRRQEVHVHMLQTGGNHAKCCMDGKRIRCLQIVSLHVPIYA